MNIDEQIEKIVKQSSMYPELQRKSESVRRNELRNWYQKFNEINVSYNLYGLDVVDFRTPDDFLDNGKFRAERYKANSTWFPYGSAFSYDYSIVMRDKRMFDAYFSRLMPELMPVTYGFILNGMFIPSSRCRSIDRFLQQHDGEKVAVKRTFGCHGDGLMSCRISDGMIDWGSDCGTIEQFAKMISSTNGSMWVMQEWLVQHPTLAEFNSSSVNTLRIVSYNTGDHVEVSKVSLLVGPEGSLINNPESGQETLYGISNGGIVSDFAYSFSNCSRTKTINGGKTIPYFSAALDAVRYAHSLIPEVFSVGWDIVVGEKGPLILEGNDGWSPRAIQGPNQAGERGMWDKMLHERELYYGLDLVK